MTLKEFFTRIALMVGYVLGLLIIIGFFAYLQEGLHLSYVASLLVFFGAAFLFALVKKMRGRY